MGGAGQHPRVDADADEEGRVKEKWVAQRACLFVTMEDDRRRLD